MSARSYPVLTCASCGHPAGWLGADGRCADCLEPERRKRLFESGVFVVPPAEVPVPSAPRGPLLARAAASLGVRSAAAREAARQWLALVDPGVTGPVEPAEGFEIEAPVHSEQPAPEGPDLLVRFQVVSLRFREGRWVAVDGRAVGKPRTATPATLPASLPMEAIAEAWADFRSEVEAFNRSVWEADSARRGQAEATANETRDAHLRQQGVSDLLS